MNLKPTVNYHRNNQQQDLTPTKKPVFFNIYISQDIEIKSVKFLMVRIFIEPKFYLWFKSKLFCVCTGFRDIPCYLSTRSVT